jgi:3-dehydroquinate synthase
LARKNAFLLTFGMEQRVIISKNIEEELALAIAECEHDKIFVLTDETTLKCCWPVIQSFLCLKGANVITIPATDAHKDLNSMSLVWTALAQGGATRHSLLINLGGGMVTDLGGFAASTFKRGINFINIPTTLLAMVDASVGGKTGINFNGLKNEVGVFNESKFVILDTCFLHTLDHENLLSGYAEMLKHSLIANEKMWAEHVTFSVECRTESLLPQWHTVQVTGAVANSTLYTLHSTLSDMIRQSVEVKEHIVLEDPLENGLRKALNVGHTVGHAFESFAIQTGRPILHGYAVAYGIICELYLSVVKTGFPVETMRQTVSFIREHYGTFEITCDDYDTLIELMTHDKKNTSGTINFTLLGGIGDIRINQTATTEEIKEALDFFREG